MGGDILGKMPNLRSGNVRHEISVPGNDTNLQVWTEMDDRNSGDREVLTETVIVVLIVFIIIVSLLIFLGAGS